MSETFGQALRRLRHAAGLSQEQLARQAHLSQSDISRYERGQQHPASSTLQTLDHAIGANGQLRAVAAASNTRPNTARTSAQPDPGDEIAALELARRVAMSDVAVETLDRLESAFDNLATAYPATSPHDLLPRVRHHLGYVHQLLDASRLTLAAHRRLVVLGGWYSLLAATVHIDLNQHGAATAHLRTADYLANHAEHPEIRAWCYETEAWRTLTSGDYRRAAQLSQRAQQLAPAGSSVEIQATAQEGRAAARIGDSTTTYRSVARVNDLADGLERRHSLEHHYQYDSGKAAAYTATTLAWLGDPEAEQHARAVIERFRPTHNAQPWPRRYASAHVDLALCAAKSGDLDQAADAARTAIESGSVAPSNWWRVAEVVQEVTAKRLPAAAELRESYRAMTGK